jgi:hypothetical protein
LRALFALTLVVVFPVVTGLTGSGPSKDASKIEIVIPPPEPAESPAPPGLGERPDATNPAPDGSGTQDSTPEDKASAEIERQLLQNK